VNKEFSTHLNPAVSLANVPASATSAGMRFAGIVLAGSAFVAVCAHLAVPLYFTPVPLSMAPFAVLVLGLLLSPRMAASTLAAYLIEGAMGLPVFSPSPAIPGYAHLIGPTGGYLLSYPLAAALIAWLLGRSRQTTGPKFVSDFTAAAFSATLGSLVILASGATWLTVLTHASAQSVFNLAVLPFLPGDALKIVAAAALSAGWTRHRRRSV
jgi:biotin transport system substrate-specific component